MIPSIYSGNEDDNMNIVQLIRELRDYGFDPNMDIISSSPVHGLIDPEDPNGLNSVNRNSPVIAKLLKRLKLT